MKIGIFGGSFNPVHKGHVRALEEFIRKAELDKVLVIPTFLPPHKEIPELWASFEDRAAMLKIALKNIVQAEVCHIEKTLYEENGEKSYTKITLQHLKSQCSADYYLYMGTDMFVTLRNWRGREYIFDNAVIVVMSRDGCLDVITEHKKLYEKEYNARIVLLESEHITASSTEVRASISSGEKTPLISEDIYEYIKNNSLYKKRKAFDELVQLAKETLPNKRFLHTLSVEKETRYLTKLLCPEFEDELARVAILHDITKYQPFNLFPQCELTEDDIECPDTVHAKTGAIFARDIGENMWRTIRYHTTGKTDMSLFEMIIFLADYVEETRKHASCIEEREKLHKELNNAPRYERLDVLRRSVCRVLEATVNYLTEKQVFIHPLTLDALEYYRTF